jgi:hypothetical protein
VTIAIAGYKFQLKVGTMKTDSSRRSLSFLLILIFLMFARAPAQADVITLVNPADFQSALKRASAGDTIALSGSQPFQINIKYRTFDPPITITSAAGQEAKASEISILRSNGIKIQNLRISSAPQVSQKTRLMISVMHSSNITFTNNSAIGIAKRYLTKANKAKEQGEGFALVRNSKGITFHKNVITRFSGGIGVLESTDLNITANTITRLQADPIQMGGVRNVEISDNRISDLIGCDQTVSHSDMIQLWSTNAKIVSGDIRILRNYLLAGDGVATQTIFLRNEQADSRLSDKSRYYSNITIRDNLIHNGHLHGITVGETIGLDISNNTVLPNPKATMGDGDNRQTMLPIILVAKTSTNVRVERNIASEVVVPKSGRKVSNFLLPKDPIERARVMKKIFSVEDVSGAKITQSFEVNHDSFIRQQEIGSILTRQKNQN